MSDYWWVAGVAAGIVLTIATRKGDNQRTVEDYRRMAAGGRT